MKFKKLIFVAFLLAITTSIYPQKSFQTKVEVVNVDVVVTTKDGEVVNEGLTADDFEVYEDKIKQEITNFSPREEPITTVLLIDYSKYATLWSAYSQGEVWYGPIEFVKSLQDEDWAAVLMYDRRVYNSKDDEENGIFRNFTQNRRELEQTLNIISHSPAIWSESCLGDAVKTVLDMIAANREDLTQKVSIILISTGLDTFSKNLYEPVLKEAQNSGVVIYTISIGQQLKILSDPNLDSVDRMDYIILPDLRLRSFAELTGGKAFLPKFISEFPGIFEEISIRLRNQYSLGYISSNTARDGKFRKIEVKINKTRTNKKGKEEKLNISHRKGYFAPKD